MKVLELFAGSRSIGKAAEELGFEVFSVDVKDFDGIDLVQDIEFLKSEQIPFIPDIIWCSPPCTTFSLAAISYHREPGTYAPTSEFAEKSDRLVIRTINLIKEYLEINPDMLWYMENPRGVLSKMWYMKGLPKATVWYCRYGDIRAKPTHVFTNNLLSLFNPKGWQPRRS